MATCRVMVLLYHLAIVAIFICTGTLHYVHAIKLSRKNLSENLDKSGLMSESMAQWVKNLPYKNEVYRPNS